MMRVWQLQDAAGKVSEIVEAALSDGPQLVTRDGGDTVIVLSYAEYQQLLNQQTLSAHFRTSPLAKAALDLRRNTDASYREIEL
ncbi:MAG: hypothetical protein OHK0022_03860 [Roseiflexaceae bacterium]